MFRSKCGKECRDTARFCSGCGNALTHPDAAPAPLSTSVHTLSRPQGPLQADGQQTLVIESKAAMHKKKKKRGILGKILISLSVVVLCFIVLVVIVAVTADDPEVTATTALEEDFNAKKPVTIDIDSAGEYQVDEIVLVVEDGTLPTSSSARITPLTLKNDVEDSDLLSDLYRIEVSETPQKDMVIKIPIPEGEDPASLSAGITRSAQNEYEAAPSEIMSYRPINVEGTYAYVTLTPDDFIAQNNQAAKSIIPFMTPVYAAADLPTSYKASVGLFGTRISQLTDGHFIMYSSRFLLDTDCNYLLNQFEDVYRYYDNLGYSTAIRTEWPFEITVEKLKGNTLALYYNGLFSNGQSISLNKNELLTGKFDETIPVFAHEWFHFIQSNYYAGQSSAFERSNLWFDEATSTYMEKVFGSSYSDVATESFLHQFNGPFPEHGSDEKQGYGRFDLINFLAFKYGDAFILKAYQAIATGVDASQAIVSATEAPSAWVDGYYRFILEAHGERSLWKSISDEIPGPGSGLDYTDIGHKLQITVPASLSDTPLLEEPCSIPGYGARLYPIYFDGELNDEMSLTLSAEDPSVHFILYAMGQETVSNNSSSVSLSNIKTAKDNNTLYLLLAVNQGAAAVNTVIKAEAVNNALVGTWRNVQKSDEGELLIDYILNSDGTGSVYIKVAIAAEQDSDSVPFTYTYDESHIYTVFSFSEKTVPYKYEFTDPNTMILKVPWTYEGQSGYTDYPLKRQ